MALVAEILKEAQIVKFLSVLALLHQLFSAKASILLPSRFVPLRALGFEIFLQPVKPLSHTGDHESEDPTDERSHDGPDGRQDGGPPRRAFVHRSNARDLSLELSNLSIQLPNLKG